MIATLEPDTATTTDLVARAAALGGTLAGNAEGHDRDGTFVEEALDAIRAAGLLVIAVPAQLGGEGATPRQVAAVQRELSHHCGATALATSMHQHVTSFTAWPYRGGLSGAEPTLRRVADDGIVLVSTGGADFSNPRGTAVKVEGGYMVSGQKIFCSQSVVGAAVSTMYAYEDPSGARWVLNMAVPLTVDGVRVLDNWLGMRGTASNDIVVEGVFVPDERRRDDDREARDRAGGNRSLRPRHGGRRWRRLLQGLRDRALLPRHPGHQVPSDAAGAVTDPRRAARARARCRRLLDPLVGLTLGRLASPSQRSGHSDEPGGAAPAASSFSQEYLVVVGRRR